MKWFGSQTGRLIAENVINLITKLADSAQETFDEIYQNLERLDAENQASYSYQNTNIAADGTITQENDNTITTTTSQKSDDGGKIITQSITNKKGEVIKRVVTTIGPKVVGNKQRTIKEEVFYE